MKRPCRQGWKFEGGRGPAEQALHFSWFLHPFIGLPAIAERDVLVINQIIYAEVSIGFERIEELEAALPENLLERRAIPWEAAFLAGKCFVKYRRHGGTRNSTLPDFFIGAHAAVSGMALLTRDVSRYRTYFPKLTLICPS